MRNILELRDVTFMDMISYPDLEIKEREVLFVVGQSGSGKSSLLKLLNGTVSPSSGTVLYKGQDVEEVDTVSLRREVLLVSQSVFLFDDTIEENFTKFYKYREKEAPAEEEIKTYLSICDAPFVLDTECGPMSGGERQRVFLAICISFESNVLLLDEPTSALDDKTGMRLFENLMEYCKKKGKTLIVVSHNKELAHKYGNRLLDLGGR